jgi:hypothetical protein
MNLENIKLKLKTICFFFVGLYSYIHRAFVIYLGLVEVIANFLTVLLFRHDDVTIHVAGKWDLNPIKAITYVIHLLIVIFLYILLF